MGLKSVEKAGERSTDAEVAAFCDLVRKGDEVDPDGLEGRVRRARLLSFGTSDGALVAVAGIKNPYSGYRAGVFEKSRSELSPQDFGVELGDGRRSGTAARVCAARAGGRSGVSQGRSDLYNFPRGQQAYARAPSRAWI